MSSGLVQYSDTPAASALWMSSAMALADSAITGTARVAGSARSWASTSRPSMSGSCMSSRIRS